MNFTLWKCKPLLVLITVLGVALLVYASIPPTTVFELDGNVVDSPAGSPDDWATLNGTGSGGANPGGSAGSSSARAFVHDPDGATIFTTGGSKDNLDVTSWRHTAGSVPDKDEIEDAFAAAYFVNSGTELIIEFGADRLAQNGDANIGIWFFQQSVGPIAGGVFSGQHQEHDILVLSAFSNGGGTSTVAVYEWDDSCLGAANNNPQVGQCADKNLRVLFNSSAVCGSADACAITNSAGVPVAWPYAPKQGTAGTVPKGGLFEGGVNITQLLEAAGVTALPCFSSFVFETRSSTSIDATLKDFVAHEFPLCGIDTTKACDGNGVLNANGDAATYSFKGTVKNAGFGTLYDVVVEDSVNGGQPTTINVVSSLAGNATANWTYPNAITTSALSVNNSATAKAALSPGGQKVIIDGTPATVTCSTQVVSAIKVDKNCTTSLIESNNLVAVKVAFSGNVCNDKTAAEGGVKITGLGLTDDPTSSDIQLSTTTIFPKGSKDASNNPTDCASYTGTYLPNDIGTQDGEQPGRYFFSDTIKVTSATPALGATLPNAGGCGGTAQNPIYGCASTQCPICPAGACPVQ